YEALTGMPPLMGDTAFDTMNMHVFEKPKDISEVAPQLNVPEEIEEVVMKALEKNPDKRYQTARELREDLPAPKVLPITLSRKRLRIRRTSPVVFATGLVCSIIVAAFSCLLLLPLPFPGKLFPAMRNIVQLFMAERTREIGWYPLSEHYYQSA